MKTIMKHSLQQGFWAAAALAATVAVSGCYVTHVGSGKPAAEPTVEYDGKWHHGAVFGLVEISGPYDLSKVCPNGWSEITTKTSFLNGFVNAFVGLYNPQTVTVRCAAGGSAAPAAAAEKSEGSETAGDPPELEGEAEEPAK
jgi:hypothetical protein